MYQPQLIEVDPQRIKFNKLNPRKHSGEEYERLKQSIQEIGIVQPPLVRHLTGIFYEVIDGEGRVSVAQELKLSTIKVISLGDIPEQEALTMLVTSNVVRDFGFLAECRGLADLHRQGLSSKKLSKVFGEDEGDIKRKVAIGYFPSNILDPVDISTGSDEDQERSFSWATPRTLRILLPLRQVIPGKDPSNNGTLDGVYDYSEVKRAIEKGRAFKTLADLASYVAERRRELFEARFNKELQERLETEIASAKKALEDAKAQEIELKVKGAEAEVTHYYQSQIAVLEAQKTEIEKKYNSALAKAAKGEKADTLEAELEAMRKKSEADRKKIQQEMQERLRQEQERQRQEQEKQLAALRAQVEASLKEQREALQKEREETKKRQEQEQKQAKVDLEAYYKEQDAKRKLKAETSYRQLVASVSEHLSQSRQSVDHITQQEMVRGMEWLTREEIAELLLQIRIVRNTLDEAEQTIQKQIGVVSSYDETTIESTHVYERSLVNHD